MAQVVVDDITNEALFDVLQQNPRGVLCCTDELGSLTASLNQYRAGKGREDGLDALTHRVVDACAVE